jgi:hypothetical protein
MNFMVLLNALQAVRSLPVETLLNRISWLYNCVSNCTLLQLCFFIVSRVPQFPSVISFEQVLLVHCTSGVYWFSVCDLGCFNKQQVLWGRSLLFASLSRSSWRAVMSLFFLDFMMNMWMLFARLYYQYVPADWATKNTEFTRFSLVRYYAGWFNVNFVDVEARYCITFVFFLSS